MYYRKTKQFIKDNKELIIKQYMEKFTEIFKNCECDEDRKTTWWFKVVEPGWECKALEDKNIYLDEGTEETFNVLIDLVGEYVEEALVRMNINTDILY